MNTALGKHWGISRIAPWFALVFATACASAVAGHGEPDATHQPAGKSAAEARSVSAELAGLKAPDLRQRGQALMRLRQPGAIAAIPALIQMLGSDTEFPQMLLMISSFAPITDSCSKECTFGGEAAETLARIGVRSDELLGLLNSGNWRIRANAARALGGLRDARAVGDLIELLARSGERWEVKGNAALALGLFKSKRGLPPARPPEPGATPVSLKAIEESRCVQSLITALKDEHAPVRAAAAMALAEFQAPEGLQPLLVAIKDSDPEVRQCVAGGLGNFGSAAPIEPLIEALHDEERTVREVAAGALGRTGNARATSALIAALKDSYANVQINAAGALGRLRSREAVEPLIALLADENDAVRAAAAAALGELGDPRARDPLLDLVRGQTRLKFAPSVSTSTNGLNVTILKREIRSEMTLLRGLQALAKLGHSGATAALKEYGRHRPDWREWWSQNQERLLKP